MKRFLLTSAAIALMLVQVAAGMTKQQVATLPHAKIEKKLIDEHPSSYYLYANRLFTEGKKDEAVFWLYTGQIRFRAHLKANPKLDPSGDPALFAAMNATIGKLINEYAGGNIKDYLAAIDRALKWDETKPNGFTSKATHTAVYEEVRAGLVKFRDSIAANADKFREQRRKAGLEIRD